MRSYVRGHPDLARELVHETYRSAGGKRAAATMKALGLGSEPEFMYIVRDREMAVLCWLIKSEQDAELLAAYVQVRNALDWPLHAALRRHAVPTAAAAPAPPRLRNGAAELGPGAQHLPVADHQAWSLSRLPVGGRVHRYRGAGMEGVALAAHL